MQVPISVDDPTQPMPSDGMTTTSDPQDEQQTDPQTAKRWQEFRQRIEVCKSYRKRLIRNWRVNIDFRRGKVLTSMPDEESVPMNFDWSFTKTKHASLFSQVPKAHVDHPPESLAAGPWVNTYERALNDNLIKGGIESTMDEVMVDTINAAGIGIAMVARETLTEDRNLSSVDLSVFPPDIQATAMQSGTLFGEPVPMETVPYPVDAKYTVRRVSPADFLWPVNFTSSNFDNAPWVGRTGRITWPEAARRFQLSEEDKTSVLGEERTVEDQLSRDSEREHAADDGLVAFDEIFYKDYAYDIEAKSFDYIHHLVFIHGKQEPVIDEPWKGQADNPTNPEQIIGSRKYPIRVLTLTYISDEDIPPSDSAVSRQQVNELNKIMSHINKQLARNAPLNWFDVNRLDPAIQQAIMRGAWQQAIPVQGDGSRIIGAIEQPAMHQENYEFEKIAKENLQELWTIAQSAPDEPGGGKNADQANFSAKIGRERARVGSFFCGIAEVLGGLMCLYDDPQTFGQGFDPSFCESLSYSITPDSTVLLDSQQRLTQLNNFLNTYAKSGWLNIQPILQEIATLVGLDPSTVVTAPKPMNPPPPNISLRLTGAKDMTNPLMLAFMIKTGQAPDPGTIEQAKQLIQASVQMPQQPQQPGAPGQPPPPGLPQPPPPNPGEANPQMSALPSVTQQAPPNQGTQ